MGSSLVETMPIGGTMDSNVSAPATNTTLIFPKPEEVNAITINAAPTALCVNTSKHSLAETYSIETNVHQISQDDDEDDSKSTDVFSPRSTAALALSSIARQTTLKGSKNERSAVLFGAESSPDVVSSKMSMSNESRISKSSGKKRQIKDYPENHSADESKTDVNQKAAACRDRENLSATKEKNRKKHREIDSPQQNNSCQTPQFSQLRQPSVVPSCPYPWHPMLAPPASHGFHAPPPMWQTPHRNHQSASPFHHQVLMPPTFPGAVHTMLVPQCYVPSVYFPPPPGGIGYPGIVTYHGDDGFSPSGINLKTQNQSQNGTAVTPTPSKKAKVLDEHQHFIPMTPSRHSMPESFKDPTSARHMNFMIDSYDKRTVPTVEEKEKYNRKNRSLGNLARTFLSHCTMANLERSDSFRNNASLAASDSGYKQPRQALPEIVIDVLAAKLNVERRRIYDVVNILEALQLVMKKAKNTYLWMGEKQMITNLVHLQNEAIQRWPDIAKKNGLLAENVGSISKNEASPYVRRHIHKKVSNNDGKEGQAKSLTRLSELFLYIFLVGYSKISLPEASDLIDGSSSTLDDLALLACDSGTADPDSSQTVANNSKESEQEASRGLKTKIRRLYDIANVFLSVGLLSKKEDKSASNAAERRPQYSWSYMLSIKEIQANYYEDAA